MHEIDAEIESEDDDLDEDDILNELARTSLSDNPQLDDALILRLTYDLATKLHSAANVARRYGLADVDSLKDYLRSHPEVVAEARKLHAIFSSDSTAEERVRMKFLHATERLIIPMAGIVADPRTPLGARIDGFKQIQRGAGMDGLPRTAGQPGQKDGGQPFNLTINFAGGRMTPSLPAITIAGTALERSEAGTTTSSGDSAETPEQARRRAYDEGNTRWPLPITSEEPDNDDDTEGV